MPDQDTPSDDSTRASQQPAHRAAQQIGHYIGSYKLIDVLGQGGMGVVYLAEQDHPRRSVALKLIRPGIAKQQLLRRFEHEAEILGRLQHPGIAQIYEAGTADTGSGPQPFFAMERVEGLPLSEYAAVHKLGIRARLELFTKVCAAVEHAHQKGVIHRDLKPGNILVTKDGQPKILDFGVARATDADIQTTTLQTDIGQLLGTIPYMSPEQASGDPDELDTRSDVYALGVVLYELLAGRLPHDLAQKMVHEAVRIIREDDPTPSRRSSPRRWRRTRPGVTSRPVIWPATSGATWRTSRSSPARRARCTSSASSPSGTRPWLVEWPRCSWC